MADDNEKVTTLETGLKDLDPEQIKELADAALGDAKPKPERVIGYIVSPEMMLALLDVCEDIPGRFYKKIVPSLQQCPQLVEDEDGNARVNG